MKLYLLVYGRELGTRTEVKACLDSLTQVESWRAELPNSFFIKSESNAKDLASALQTCLGVEKPRFYLVQIPQFSDHERSWGWLVDGSWQFLGKKINQQKEN